ALPGSAGVPPASEMKTGPDRRIKASLDIGDKQIIFQFSDPGIELTAAEREGLFEKFRPSNESNSKSKSSLLSTLALPLARSIIESHGGKVEITKDEDGENQ